MRDFSLLDMPVVIGPPGTKIAGRWPKLRAPITRPGTILSQMPSIERGVEHVVGQRDRGRHARSRRGENSDSSMPGWPWVTPSHIAGTPPANCATPPASRAASLDQRREALERLVRREHVVVGGDDARCWLLAAPLSASLSLAVAGGEAVGEVAAGQMRRAAAAARP